MGYGYEIVRLRLVNFAHFTSLGLSDFEIDRRGSKNSIITIIGANGSGKSLLTSAWTPRVNDATNNRKKALIVPDKEGLKELDILTTDEDGIHGPYMYKCRIIYGLKSNNCSMIRVDRDSGEEIELNPSGLVTTYENLLSEEFGMNKNYKNIGYLSPEITSLVGMTPSVRYEYISTWLPDISSYMEAYKLVFKRINSINRQVKMLENDIGDISIENVMREKNLLNVRIEDVAKRIDNVKESKMKLSFIVENLANVTDDYIRKVIHSLNKNKKILDSQYDKLRVLSRTSLKYCGNDGYVLLDKDIALCESRMGIVNSELSNVSRTIDDNRIRLKEVEYNLGMLSDTGDSLPEISSMIERIEKSMIDINETLTKYRDNYDYLGEIGQNFTINEFNILSNTISTISDKCVRITDLVPVSKMDNISDYSEINDKESKTIIMKMRDYDDRISKTLERISLLKNSPLDPSILDLVPSFCDTNVCGIVKEVKRLLSPDIEVDKLNDLLQKLYEDKSNISLELDSLNEEHGNMTIAISYISDVDHTIMRDKLYISFLPNHIRLTLSEGIVTILSHIGNISRDMETIREYVSLRDQFNVYNSELKVLKDKESSLRVIRNMNSDFMNLSSSIDELQAKKGLLFKEGEELLSNHKILTELRETLSEISESVLEYNTYVKSHIDTTEKLKLICKDWYYREKLTKAITKLDIEYKNLVVENSRNVNHLDSLNNSIVTKKSLIDMRDRLVTSIKDLNLLQEAWNPKTGIPSLFISNFLNKIHAKSNEYLEALNGKNLKILRFEIGQSAREFPIVMEKIDGSIVPDVSELSSGEISLTTLAISMAMINVVSGSNLYNVVRLDEVDAMLDHDRRKLYIEMIQDRLKEINSAQCLVITHNDEWDDIETDMIIMPGAYIGQNLKNKNVILDLSNIDPSES